MNTTLPFLTTIGVILASAGLSARADEPKSHKNKEATLWVAPPTGSLLGGGYADSGKTHIRAKTIAREQPGFRNAIQLLDAQGDVTVAGVGLVPTAVAWQTKVPVRTLVTQQVNTRLSYGELLVANSLAEGSGKSFNEIIAMRTRTKTWGELAGQLHINPDSIKARAEAASSAISYAEARRNRRREQNLRDSGFETRHSQNPNAVEHGFGQYGGG
jgi:hypothetical protein